MCSHWDRPSHSRSSGVPCGVALDGRWQQRRQRMSGGIFAGTTSNGRHNVQKQNWNCVRSWKNMSHRLVYHKTPHCVVIKEGFTHASTVAMKGRSEYICDRFSSSSVATEGEFRTTTSISKSRMYIISPKNCQSQALRLRTIVLTILRPQFCVSPERFLGINGEGTSQEW